MQNLKNILIHSKDNYLKDLLLQFNHNFNIDLIVDENKLYKHFMQSNFDLIIIDNMDIDITQVAEELHKKIIIISLDTQHWSNISSLKSPILIKKLILQMVNIDKSYNSLQQIQLNESYIFFPKQKIIKKKITETIWNNIDLTDKEALIIEKLYSLSGESISKLDLLKDVWGYNEHSETHTIETHIYRLRQKTGNDNSLIITSDNGYKLNI